MVEAAKEYAGVWRGACLEVLNGLSASPLASKVRWPQALPQVAFFCSLLGLFCTDKALFLLNWGW
jgi:hypothetical protein